MATRPYAYFRVVQYGHIDAVQDWSTGFSMTGDFSTVPTNTDLVNFLTDLATEAANWWTAASGMTNGNSSTCTYDGYKIYYYPESATHAEFVADHPFSSPLAGSSSAGQIGSRSAIVSSQLTGISGRENRGRRYIPWTADTLTDYQVSDTRCTQISTRDAALMTAANAIPIGAQDVRCVVANHRDFPPTVITCKVDSKVDTQRRRSDKLGPLHTESHSV